MTRISSVIGYAVFNGLKLWVAPIAKRPVFTMLASAEKYLSSLFSCIFQRCKISAFVGSIAQRLLATFSTGAPKIRSTLFNFCWKRTFLRYDRSRHEILQELVYIRLVIEDLSQNNKKIVFKNIEYAAQMFGAENILNSKWESQIRISRWYSWLPW